ncbi:MAG TPA: hypothetical protein GX699_09880 [Firmicutes bacterium]|nr:hypothetical protein [Bacillota bacterium]
MIKLDFRKEHRELYSASASRAAFVTVPALNYLMVLGKGDPNTSERYREAVAALFSLSYTLKFMIRKGPLQIDYRVMPLEGLWWTEGSRDFLPDKKDDLNWIAMIMQPTLVTEELLQAAKKQVAGKKSFRILPEVGLGQYNEGFCAQILHLGPYSEEGETISRLHAFIKEQAYEPAGKHHEIYLNNPARTDPVKLKTILRQPVKKV